MNDDFNRVKEFCCELHFFTGFYCYNNCTYTPFTRYNRLSNRFDNRFDNRLYRVNGALPVTFSRQLAKNS